MLTYKRKLILTVSQQKRIDSWIDTCRFVYNMGLEIKISAYRNKMQQVHRYELQKQITSIRDVQWIKDVPVSVLYGVTERLDVAYKTFFQGGGFPKFANKKRFKSISFTHNIPTIHIEENSIKLPKIGILKIVKDAIVLGNIKQVEIIKDITGYFACIATDHKKDIQCKDENQVLGIDMGVSYFTVDSNGNFITNPKHFKKYEQQLRIENRSLSRKKKYGKNWKKQAKRVALLYHKIANVRKDFLHKESTKIAKQNHTVILEDLNIAGMVKNRHLSKHILDCGWGIFRTMLSYKTNVFAINPKFTSQTCNECGSKDSKYRITQSEFACACCGHFSNADLNAAKNIRDKGIVFISQREPIGCAFDKKPTNNGKPALYIMN